MSATAETTHPAWYRATTLHERTALSRAATALSTPSALELARQRLQRWCRLSSFQNTSVFAERLSVEGLEEAAFVDLLGETDDAIRDRLGTTPSWLASLDQAFRDYVGLAPALFARPNDDGQDDDGTDYLRLAAPLLQRARKRLQQTIRAMVKQEMPLPFDPETIEALLTQDLPQQFQWTLARTVALEMYIAGLEETLSGQTPEERYQSFFEHLSDPVELRRLYQTYPVLARLLTARLDNWYDASGELLERLVRDWPKLKLTFSPNRDPGHLVELQSGLGDRHLGGRSVCSLRFSSGLKLIYKPQPMAVAVHFNELLRWLNAHGHSTPWRVVEIIDCDSHGWVEFVEAEPCQSLDEVRRFYRRQGSLLALLHALGGCDVHAENIIAQGEHPVLIDFETVIHPHWQGTSETTGAETTGAKTEQCVRFNTTIKEQTVLRISLLPVPKEGDPLDRSGLGSMADQSVRCPHFEGSGTDRMRLGQRHVAMPEGLHRPTLRGRAAKVTDHIREVAKGFTDTSRLLLRRRDDLMAPQGPIRRFAGDRARIVIRPTRVYGALLHESYHPYLLGNALDRQRHFDHLWLDSEDVPQLKQLIPLETEALEVGDIPYFSTQLDSRDLLAGPHQRLENFLPTSGYQQLEERLRRLDEDDLERQLALLSNTLVAHRYNTQDIPPPPEGYSLATSKHMTGDHQTGDHQALVSAAIRVGERLECLALRTNIASGKEAATWFQPSVSVEGTSVLTLMQAKLYDGLPGMALFLAYLGKLSGQERFTSSARAALATLDLQLEEAQHGLETPGAFQGWGGLIYAFTQLSQVLEEPQWQLRALDLLERLPPLIETDHRLDVISGVAGLIPVLLTLHRRLDSPRALELAVLCGRRLEATAAPQEGGVGWPSVRTGRALGGFSHGAAGIAWALLELSAAISTLQAEPLRRDLSFADLAFSALRYERTLFDPTSETWRDLRASDGAPTYRAAWCNGAPGIGLGRLGMLRHVDDAELRREVESAIRSSMADRMGISHSLCHGDLGNLELLLQGQQILGDRTPSGESWDDAIGHRTQRILADIEQRGWLDGTLEGMETPGLMSGLAGIGYGLLRLAKPHQVPALLLLADNSHAHPRRS